MRLLRTILNICFAVIVVLALVLLIYLISVNNSDGNSILPDTDMDFSDNWVCDGANVSLPVNNTSGTDRLVLSVKLPSSLSDDSVLVLNTNKNPLTADIEGTVLKSTIDKTSPIGNSVVSSWNYIRLLKQYEGKTLTLTVYNDSIRKATVNSAMLGAKSEVALYAYTHYLDTMFMFLIMMLISLIIIIISVPLSRKYKNFGAGRYVYIAGFLLLASLWSISESHYLNIVYCENNIVFYLSCVSLMLIPIPLMSYAGSVLRKFKKIYAWALSVYMVLYITFMSLLIAGIVSVSLILLCILIFMSLVILLTGFLCIKELIARKTSGLVELLSACLIITLSAVMDIAFSYLPGTREPLRFFGYGLLIFMLYVIINIIKRDIGLIGSYNSFESLTSTIPCGICRVSADGEFSIYYANDHFYSLFGCTKEEARKAGFTKAASVVPDETVAALNRKLNKLFDMKKSNFETEQRVRRPDGQFMWIMLRGTYSSLTNDITVVVMNVTRRKTAEEKLRVSEEEYRIAVKHSNHMILRYEIASKKIIQSEESAEVTMIPPVFEDVPESVIKKNIIRRESIDDYLRFYQQIRRGIPHGYAVIHRNMKNGSTGWFRADYTIVYDDSKKPLYAIITYCDISDQREKELAYEKWKYDYSLLSSDMMMNCEFNLTDDILISTEGSMFPSAPPNIRPSVAEMAKAAVGHIAPGDRESFIGFYSRKNLLARYSENNRSDFIEFQRQNENGEKLWTSVTSQLVPDLYSDDIKCYVFFRDINEKKLNELLIMARSEEDPLTKLYNRTAFEQKVNKLFAESGVNVNHTLAILDVDAFKQINDNYGHQFGDEVLVCIADTLRSALRSDDIIARLGGDEFVFCLKNARVSDKSVCKRVEEICRKLNNISNKNIKLSASIGLAGYPDNGRIFAELYPKADEALYKAKESGKNTFALYSSYNKH